MQVETPAQGTPGRDERSLSGARTPSSPPSRAFVSATSSGDSYATATSGMGARKSISPAQKVGVYSFFLPVPSPDLLNRFC
jgi:hypothetical protein